MKTCFLFWWVTFLGLAAMGQVSTVSEDKDWKNQQVMLKNTLEAELIIRLGDVDNLNFGWPEGFDPFCGRMTEAHDFPWEADPADLPGFDRILLSSAFLPEKERLCGSDGYTVSYDKIKCKPVTWKKGKLQNSIISKLMSDKQLPCKIYCSTREKPISDLNRKPNWISW
jgi:hypothetical protein